MYFMFWTSTAVYNTNIIDSKNTQKCWNFEKHTNLWSLMIRVKHLGFGHIFSAHCFSKFKQHTPTRKQKYFSKSCPTPPKSAMRYKYLRTFQHSFILQKRKYWLNFIINYIIRCVVVLFRHARFCLYWGRWKIATYVVCSWSHMVS